MVVERHGGHIAVQSREGEGSRFTVHLPLAAASQGRDASQLEALAAEPATASLEQ
jgi:K+-sensing histidine kinase KdpD